MRHVIKALGLWLLLIAAQQGAVVHELSHFSRASNATARVDSRVAADAACVLCPVFAQVLTPAFSHAFHIPPLVRAASERIAEPRYFPIDAAVPQPRSRGPPSLS
jgi:hypothetical protein